MKQIYSMGVKWKAPLVFYETALITTLIPTTFQEFYDSLSNVTVNYANSQREPLCNVLITHQEND
jgi:hypothetical protein